MISRSWTESHRHGRGPAPNHPRPGRRAEGGERMSDRDRTADENAALRARISALSAASLRINASLDLETVLNEVVDSARALTGARYGAIATIGRCRRPPGLRHLGLHRRGAPQAGGMARRATAVRVFPRPAGTAEAGRRARLRALARVLDRPAALEDLPGHADAPPGRPCRQLLPGREGGRGGIHGRGRGGLWCCSPHRRRRRSPTRAPIAPSSALTRAWKP